LHRSVAETARGLGLDGAAYRGLSAPLVERSGALFSDLLAPPIHVPRHPLLLARFGAPGLLSASALGRLAFRGERARALLAGAAAHSMLSLHEPITAAFGLVMLISAHAGGWPFARGGRPSAGSPGRSMWAGRGRRSRGPRIRSRAAGTPSGRSCCSPSRPCSIRRGRPRAGTWRGRTATSRTARGRI